MRDAIQGMLTMSRGGRSGSSLFVLGEKSSLEQQTAKRVGDAVELEEEEEQRLMSGYYQDSEYGEGKLFMSWSHDRLYPKMEFYL